ncbi:hypothetical protein WEH80_34345 [Actinomycetes bacterium KLBMP 9759]
MRRIVHATLTAALTAVLVLGATGVANADRDWRVGPSTVSSGR